MEKKTPGQKTSRYCPFQLGVDITVIHEMPLSQGHNVGLKQLLLIEPFSKMTPNRRDRDKVYYF
jgi:hypothetical protein